MGTASTVAGVSQLVPPNAGTNHCSVPQFDFRIHDSRIRYSLLFYGENEAYKPHHPADILTSIRRTTYPCTVH